MVNPITTNPVALPTDLVNIELPQPMDKAVNRIASIDQGAHTGTSTDGHSTGGSPHQADTPLDRMLEQINDSMRAWATGMRFDVDEDIERIVVSIVDTSSGEVLRTVPTEAVLRVAKMITQLQGGGVNTQA